MGLKQKFLFIFLFKEFDPFNCTLWDWNLKELADMTGKEYLLIAPYGIETMFSLFVFLSDKNF